MLIALLTGLAAAPSAPAADGSIAILPGEITLGSPAARQRLIVERIRDGRYAGQITEGVTITSGDPAVVKIEDGVAAPVGNGKATITATLGDSTAEASVIVRGMDRPFVWSFSNHVQPLLAKVGCSSGACHGAAAGKSGFKLSLRGYDDVGDHRTITRHALGRRIVPSDPARSLLLLKPTAYVPHKGGRVIEVGSVEYRILSQWIAAGAPGPRPDEPRIERIEIVPDHIVLDGDAAQQMLVQAHFSDGSVRDVTHWAKYTAADSSVAVIDEEGRVEVKGRGEGAITAWYLSKIAIASIAVPYDNDPAPETFARAPRRNLIDDLVLEKLSDLNLPPSPRCDDATFLRRAYLDTIGAPPTPDEARRFLADNSPDKRDRLIDDLLSRPEFVDYWAYKWSDLLLVNSERLRPSAMWAYYKWLRDRVAADTPWDELARRLVTATGSTLNNGAANFYVLHDEPREMAETVSVAFLGMSINCARCHNHPMEKWTNDQYYGMASLFARVRRKNAAGDGHFTVFSADSGELVQPLTGRPQPPRPLDAEPVPFDAAVDRRRRLADWLTDPANPYFTRAIVNRIWANFMGVGLVEPVDDMRQTNPPSNPALLDALADYLVARDYDLKALMRLILRSETYQRSSEPLPGNADDRRFYARYYPRRLMAEVMLDAISRVTGAPTEFKGFPRGWRALQLPDSNVESYFLTAFGRPERQITCSCERTDEPSMTQVLHLANGKTIDRKLRAKGNRIDQLLAAGTPDGEIVEEAYLATLARYPTEAEKRRVLEVLKTADDQTERRVLIEDLYWGLLTSKRFLFNH